MKYGKINSFIMMLSVMLLSVLPSYGQGSYYVSPNGNDSNSGSLERPFRTLERAIDSVDPGDSIYLRGGIYKMDKSPLVINREKSGREGAMISVAAYHHETPVLQFDDIEKSSSRGIVLDANYWHWKGIIIERAGDNGMLLSGNNSILEACVFRYNHDSGLQVSRYRSDANSKDKWPSNNLILNCESHDNRDSDSEDADGFAPKLTVGEGNIFRGCVSHHNIDDGWDLYSKSSTGPIGVVTLENCIAHNNGVLSDGSTSGGGDKNGFKLGSSATKTNHIVRRCIAFNNGKHGFTDNGNIGSIQFLNTTSYNNGGYNFHVRDGASHVFRNSVSFEGSSTDRIVGDAPVSCNALTDNDMNWSLVAERSDFVTLTPGPDADPTSNGFLNLNPDSNFVDAGCQVSGVSYDGSAPDLGAVEGSSFTDPDDNDSTLPPTGVWLSIISKNSDNAIDVAGVSKKNGANILQWTPHGNANQLWKLINVNDNGYKLVSKNSGKCLAIERDNTANGINVHQWEDTDSLTQQWLIKHVNDGFFKIISKASGLALDVEGVSAERGANIYQWSYHGGDNQLWRFETGVDDDSNPEVTLQENQTGFCGVDGIIEDEHSGYTGSGYANTENVIGYGINYRVNVKSAGNYVIEIRYATKTDRPAQLIQNSNIVASHIDLPSTGSWTQWERVTTSAFLDKGSSWIRLEAIDGSGLPNVDYVKLTGADSVVEQCD